MARAATWLVAAWMAVGSVPATAFDVTVATGDNYPPYTDQSLPDGGMATRLVKAAFDASALSMREVVWLPWARALEEARTVRVDATFPWLLNETRLESFLASDPLIETDSQFYTQVGITPPRTLADLTGKRLCRPHGYAFTPNVQAMVDRGDVHRESPTGMMQCFRLLSIGRVDMVQSTPGDAANAMATGNLDPALFRSDPRLIERTSLHLLVSRDHPEGQRIINAFNEGLAYVRMVGKVPLTR